MKNKLSRYTKLILFVSLICLQNCTSTPPDQETTVKAQNPIIFADVPDPSVLRVGDTYYMSSTTMHVNPGVPIMKSTDLVNWEIVNYAYTVLADNDALSLRDGQNAYGRGSWASSLKQRGDTFYLTTFSYSTGQTHIYHTRDIENGPWSEYTINQVYHDMSLYFEEDGRVFMTYGAGDIHIIELNAEVTGIKPGSESQIMIPNASSIAGDRFIVPAEGGHLHKIDDMYYMFLIVWPADDMRTQLVYRSESLAGPWEGRIILKDRGIAQGGLIETPSGDWFAMLFEDHGAVGRIPHLIPVRWEDRWPVFGTDFKAPKELNLPAGQPSYAGIVASDNFDSAEAGRNEPGLVWQWNHNPNDQYWSLTERPGYLRLTNGRIDTCFTATQNTLTQRTFGPVGAAYIEMDISGMRDGDIAGLGALQKNFGYVGVRKTSGKTEVIMVNAGSGAPTVIEEIPLSQETIRLRIDTDFRDKRDVARFYFSLENREWIPIGDILNMSYTLPHFMGYRFALFNYATQETGGFVDFDYYQIDDTLLGDF